MDIWSIKCRKPGKNLSMKISPISAPLQHFDAANIRKWDSSPVSGANHLKWVNPVFVPNCTEFEPHGRTIEVFEWHKGGLNLGDAIIRHHNIKIKALICDPQFKNPHQIILITNVLILSIFLLLTAIPMKANKIKNRCFHI